MEPEIDKTSSNTALKKLFHNKVFSRRNTVFLTAGSFCAIILIDLNPVNNMILRVALLVAIISFWSGLLSLLWKITTARMFLAVFPLLIIFILSIPGGNIDQNKLKALYLKQIIKYKGTKYLRGGENSFGIDCSGLPRKALRDALLYYSITSISPKALRMFLEQWWFDASAKALRNGYRNYTMKLAPQGEIANMDCSKLTPGDLAVTPNGIHVLVYLGKSRWIQAAPETGCVKIFQVGRDISAWFNVSVSTCRWTILNPTNK